MLKSHAAEWSTILTPEAVEVYGGLDGSMPVDESVQELAMLAVLHPFYLLQNTVSSNALKAVDNAPIHNHSIAVGGLGSDSYAGLIFWDADLRMHPGLAATFPDAGECIASYRVQMLAQAKRNVGDRTAHRKNTLSSLLTRPRIRGRVVGTEIARTLEGALTTSTT